jgi:Ser/Thr protein kinase RdoA (MazF antagonist)
MNDIEYVSEDGFSMVISPEDLLEGFGDEFVEAFTGVNALTTKELKALFRLFDVLLDSELLAYYADHVAAEEYGSIHSEAQRVEAQIVAKYQANLASEMRMFAAKWQELRRAEFAELEASLGDE